MQISILPGQPRKQRTAITITSHMNLPFFLFVLLPLFGISLSFFDISHQQKSLSLLHLLLPTGRYFFYLGQQHIASASLRKKSGEL